MYLVSYSPNSVLRNSTGNRFCSAYCWRVIPGGGFLGVRALFLAASLTLRIFATSEVSHFSPQHLKLSTPKNCRCGREHFGHSFSTLPPLFVGAGNTLCSSWWVNLVDVDGFGTGGCPPPVLGGCCPVFFYIFSPYLNTAARSYWGSVSLYSRSSLLRRGTRE